MMQPLTRFAEKSCDLILNTWVYSPAWNLPPPKTIAHRGAWDFEGCNENTMLAFERARMVGAFGIEFDVHFTKDNVPVVHHDPTLSRIFKNPGVIKDMTYKELCSVTQGSLTQRSATQDLPTLSQVLELEGLHFMIEIKTALSSEQLKILRSTLENKAAIEDFHLLAIDADLVREISGLPNSCWILVGELNLQSRIELSVQKKLAGVAGHYLGMSKKNISQLHRHGLKAGVGFVPTQNLFYREWRREVDWVFSNSISHLF